MSHNPVHLLSLCHIILLNHLNLVPRASYLFDIGRAETKKKYANNKINTKSAKKNKNLKMEKNIWKKKGFLIFFQTCVIIPTDFFKTLLSSSLTRFIIMHLPL